MTKLRRGDIVKASFLNDSIGIVVAIHKEYGVCVNWIVKNVPRFVFDHKNPDCDIWLSDSDLKKITHAAHID